MKYFEREKIHLAPCSSSKASLHEHAFLELAYVISGKARHYAAESEMTVKKGDFFVIDYRVKHAYERVGDEVFTVINCLFLPDFIDSALLGCDSFERLASHYLIHMRSAGAKEGFPYLFHDADGRVGRLLTEMLEEYEQKLPGYVELLRSNLISVIVLALRSRAYEEAVSRDFYEVCRYISDHYAEHLTLTALAAKAHYSLPYFCKRFQEETGLTFTAYLERIRVDAACRLLANTRLRVTEVAAAVGYHDTDSFLRIFRRNMGMPPTAYRAQIREKL